MGCITMTFYVFNSYKVKQTFIPERKCTTFVLIKSVVFWDEKPYNLVEIYWLLEESAAFIFRIMEVTLCMFYEWQIL
jgi:hypothetical protein